MGQKIEKIQVESKIARPSAKVARQPQRKTNGGLVSLAQAAGRQKAV
jgi:hypothetical protein